MIPLMLPQHPTKNQVWRHFQESLRQGLLSNIGPCYLKASEEIKKLTTYNTLVCNATLGLELALRARLKPGSRVLIPSFTFKATYLAVVNAGMVPVCTSVDESTWAIRPDPLGCDAMVVVSPFGHSIDFGPYEALGAPIFYDLAGAWGLHYKGPNVAVYSFHATKNLPIGEGGAVVSADLELIERISWMARFKHTNAKLSELSCAVLCAQLENPPKVNTALYKWYEHTFKLTPSSLLASHCSLFVFSVSDSKKLYKLVHDNHVFVAKRYYYPLIEDAYDVEVQFKTPTHHQTRKTVAFPRNLTLTQQDKVSSLLCEL